MPKYVCASTATEHISDCLKIPLCELVDVFANIQSADVAPVRHGKWVNKGDYAVCTECGERSGTQYDGVEPIPLLTKLCPNCGAKMDGDEE